LKNLKIVLKKFYDKYFINYDFFDYFEKSFFILFIICICSLDTEFKIIPLKIILVSIVFWNMVWEKEATHYKNKNFANPKEELATMLRERLKFDIGLIFTCSLMASFFLTNFEYGADKNMGIFLGLLDYKKLDSDLYEFSFNGFSFFLVFVFSLFFVFVILYLLSFLYCDMKYLMTERGGLSKKEYNLRFRTLEDIIKTCTNEKSWKNL